ncbi:nicotinate-nucleotide--dimethylbenzimidazole phosphoribosyltransferase [Alkalicoccus luteus]|uniref:Nicotinate-nucleotide--dimethylbenzimidazole phosphoribosyltransferase n=1 Tax=Alkalicoccus luteus TaxID=1237094 RepID=A0A969PRL1_9BACI|nr:nicotinate-nucleotide--dimethylbenzimidazole phosphoribosyltransferase [Alkalicoccus luteus]NJP39140.1 nicotinate-nucleotide--dimethylbenzimidazole phosphoribosyltransferase [Alkalicoccus luteus]
MNWREAAENIPEIDKLAAEKMRMHLDTLTKPQGSLGRLEELAVMLAGMQGTVQTDKPAVLVFAGDHGVTAEGVSLYGSEVTALMAQNFVAGKAAVNVLARQIGADVYVYNVGIDATDTAAINRNVRRGTGNIAKEPAMTTAEVKQALQIGADAVEVSKADIIIPGDMGIGNTTASSALLCAYKGLSPEAAAGSGTGVEGQQLKHKIEVIGRAVKRSDAKEPLHILADLGGLEIAAMTGAMIRAASMRKPVLVDGFIATVAAIAAAKLAPGAERFFLYGHKSAEAGHAAALEAAGGEPLLDLGMRLGEGTGAAAAYPLLKMAQALTEEMATFADIGLA